MALKLTAWSYSRYAAWALCPLQFKFKFLDKLPEPGSPAMQRGDEIHKGTAAYISNKVDVLPRDAMQNAVALRTITEIRAMPAESKQVEQQWGYRADFEPTGWFGGDTWFRSILDAGVMYDDMTYELVDWKTGKRYGSNQDQMETQALAVMKRFKPVKHVTTRLVYLDSTDSDPFEIAEFPANHAEKLAEKWRGKVAPMFADTVFAPRPNEKCRFCHFSRSKSGKCAFG
jgi:hypothetical protein